jgi:hypothetical protein
MAIVIVPSRYALVTLAFLATFARADEPKEKAKDATEPPAYREFVVIPLRVHVLKAEDLPEVDCALKDEDIRRIVGKVNRIWHVAGIHWGLESIAREPAARQGRFKLVRDLDGAAPVGLFRVLLPEESRKFDGLHVYYIHKFAVNGIYMGEDYAIVQETARLREVEGGIDEPLPRVTAHELGHALGLPHRQDRTNLLASGTTGTLLNVDEVARVREHAPKLKGAATVAEVRRRAEDAEAKGDTARARLLWGWLAEVPGSGAEEAKGRLEKLKRAE